MKNIFTKVKERLEAEVSDLKWIDLEKGQLNYEKPPILFPAALIQIQYPNTENLSQKIQHVEAYITVKFVEEFKGNTSNITPSDVLAESLNYLEQTEEVYKKLQGFETEEFNPLERINQHEEIRQFLKVISITFKTQFTDATASELTN